MDLLRTENLSHVYSKGTPFEMAAIKNINVSFRQNEFIGIIGHTGSGKSTLIQHFNGILKPDEGKVFLDNKDIWEKPKEIRKVRFKVGLCFQYPEYQLFEETIQKDIAFGPKNMGLSENEIELRVQKAAQALGIKKTLLQKSPFDISGGEKRRAAIAGVIAMEPKILILDEPTAGLDPHGRDMVLDYIKQYQKEYRTTVIIVSHSMEDIAKLADRILVMNKAEIAMFGDADEIFSRSDELLKIGLDIPQITKVFIGLKNKGADVPTNIYTVERARDYIAKLKLGGG